MEPLAGDASHFEVLNQTQSVDLILRPSFLRPVVVERITRSAGLSDARPRTS